MNCVLTLEILLQILNRNSKQFWSRAICRDSSYNYSANKTTCKCITKEMMQQKAMSWPKGKVLRTGIICGVLFKNFQVPYHKCLRLLKVWITRKIWTKAELLGADSVSDKLNGSWTASNQGWGLKSIPEIIVWCGSRLVMVMHY